MICKNRKRAVTLTEILIAISIGVAVLVPTSLMFSSSGQLMEKSSNLGFASGLARYLIQGMMTMPMNEIVDVPIPGVSCCDPSDDNIYFKNMFNLIKDEGDLKKGMCQIGPETTPKFFNRAAKFDFRYSIKVGEASPSNTEGDLIKSVSVLITWKEFGVDKVYESHAYIVPR